jgi:dipeptide transport system ATP-binding protein
MVFQNPYASLNPRQTVRATLAEPLKLNTTLAASERNERIQAMAARVGLKPEHLARFPHMFSGGQRQRIAIARAMMLRPQVVVADEPTSALDVSIQAQILNLFMDLQDEYGTAFVFISHNLAVVEHVAQDVLVMYFGRIVESGPKATIFAQPLHPYTQALMSATPALPKRIAEALRRCCGTLGIGKSPVIWCDAEMKPPRSLLLAAPRGGAQWLRTAGRH